jgi:hypothetical protein
MVNNSESEISVAGCQSAANVSLRLLKNLVTDASGNSGPTQDVTSDDLVTDYEAPEVISYQSSAAGADMVEYRLEFSESVSGLKTTSFITNPSCAISKLEGQGSSYQIWLTGCVNESELTLKPLSASDDAGNLGPVSETVGNQNNGDTLAPSATIVELERTNKSLSPSFELRFDEQVRGLTINAFSRMGSAKDCAFTLATVTAGSVYRVDSSGCSAGSLKIQLLAGSVSDTHQNPGPTSAIESDLVRIADEVEPNLSTSARVASLQAPPRLISKQASRQAATSVKSIPKDADTQNILLPKVESLEPEPWLSVAIALLALAVARGSRGRRVSRR